MTDSSRRRVGEAICIQGHRLRYDLDLAALPVRLAERVAPLGCDAAAEDFVRCSLRAPHGALASALYGGLRRLMSDYDAYGLLGMYPMHLLSRPQFRSLLGETRGQRLLDVGAGSGAITALAAHGFEQVMATEASRVMRRKLRARGFRVLMHDVARAPLAAGERFDAVLCLNVLDRCSHPRSLLLHLSKALAPQGRLLLSVPLPLSPHVHVGAATVDPDEPLPPSSGSFEGDAARLADELLAPSGFILERLCRAPYLCRGDARTPLYVLDTAVVACTLQAAG